MNPYHLLRIALIAVGLLLGLAYDEQHEPHDVQIARVNPGPARAATEAKASKGEPK